MTLSYIPSDTNAEGILKAPASGVLPNGKAVIVNADGTVSVVEETSATQSIGTRTTFNSETTYENVALFDSNSDKVVLIYFDGDISGGAAIVGTVSGNSISFGTETSIYTSGSRFLSATFDSNSNKVVVFYKDEGNSNYGTAKVGTVSGTSISFGSAVVFESATSDGFSATFDSNSNKAVVAYRIRSAPFIQVARVGTVSGTSISFGSYTQWQPSGFSSFIKTTFDSNSNKVVIAYQDLGNSSYGTAVVGTVSGTSISFGSPVVFESADSPNIGITFDNNAGKVVVAYRDGGNSNYGTAIVGTVSGTSISFGTPVVFHAVQVGGCAPVFNSIAEKVVISYIDQTAGSYVKFVSGTVSGASISFGSPVTLDSNTGANEEMISSTFDSNAGKIVTIYSNSSSSNRGESIVFQVAYTSTNLTSENYIGMSSGPDKSQAATLGTGVVYEAASTDAYGGAFDSNSNRIVLTYKDVANSDYGTAVVGTVSGTSITFGTPVVFESAGISSSAGANGVTFDSNSNKVVIAYNDVGNSQYGTAIVGTVDPSDNSISFGSAAVFSSASTDDINAVFDTNSNKVVITFAASGCKAVVATVSGTSISFGTPVTLDSDSASQIKIVFDSTTNKVVMFWRDGGTSPAGIGKARVGTVSGTNISFGTEAVFYNNEVSGIAPSYDSFNNKVGVFYRKGDVSASGFVVGTVNGTDISFGSEVAVAENMASYQSGHFDSDRNLCIATYKDSSNVSKYVVASVSGTSATIATAVELAAANSFGISFFNTTAGKSIYSFKRNYADANDRFGTAIVFSAALSNRGQVASGSQATTNIIGSVSSNQSSLTAGQAYYVQTDGTIGLTADDPSVFAGTAISATKLIVKT